MQHIAIITVVYNNYADLADFFASFEKQTDKKFRIYIADLSSDPQEINLPDYAEVIRGENKGYAYGLNLGLEKARADGCEKFVFMNNDTTVAKNFVESVRKSLNKNPCSLIGGKIYYSKGYEYHKDKYNKKDLGKVLWYAGGIMDWDNAFVVHRGVDEVDTGLYNTFEETDFVTGCLMAFDAKLIEKAGKMDDSYFLYYEDADWNEQIKQAGCKVYYDPSIVIWHKNAQSTGGSGSRLHEKYQWKNRLKFGLKYAPLRTKLHLLKNYLLSFVS